MAATDRHLTQVFHSILHDGEERQVAGDKTQSAAYILLGATVEKTDQRTANEKASMLLAEFSGEASFSSTDKTTKGITHSSIYAMMEAALLDVGQKWALLYEFFQDPVLFHVNDVQVVLQSYESYVPENGSPGNEGLKTGAVVAICFVVILFAIAFVGLVFLMYSRRRDNGESDSFSKSTTSGKSNDGDTSSEEGLYSSDEEGDFDDESESQNCWMDQWAHASSPVKPRPRRPKRKSKRQSSTRSQSLTLTLTAIDEEDGGDEESTVQGMTSVFDRYANNPSSSDSEDESEYDVGTL